MKQYVYTVNSQCVYYLLDDLMCVCVCVCYCFNKIWCVYHSSKRMNE